MMTRPRSEAVPRKSGIIVLAAAAYVLIGTGTSMLSAAAPSVALGKGWRLAAWVLSVMVFSIHFAIERQHHQRPVRVATRVALAVAIGAFGVAALGPVRMHWGEPTRGKLVLLSLVAWPILTGVPAFVVALVGAVALDRLAEPNVDTAPRQE